MGGREEDLDATAQKTRGMMHLWYNLSRGPFAKDENIDEEDDDDDN
jgi:hypothetical protein